MKIILHHKNNKWFYELECSYYTKCERFLRTYITQQCTKCNDIRKKRFNMLVNARESVILTVKNQINN